MNSEETCSANYSNYTQTHLKDTRIDIVKCSIGVTSFLLILPFVLFHFKPFPIGPTGAVLLGATMSVLTQTITQKEVYEVLGAPENVRTICLLLGMMIMAQYLERELLAEKLLYMILKEEGSFSLYLLVVTAFDFFLAAIFTNDVACVALTPLILTHWAKRKYPKSRQELSTLLLGIATSANIGSASTVFGNPQMALIASKTSQPLFAASRLDMRRCIFYLWLPAGLCFIANFGFLMLYWRMLKWNDDRKITGRRIGPIVDKTTANGMVQNAALANLEAVSGETEKRSRNSFQLGDHPPLPLYTRAVSISSLAAPKDEDDWTPSNRRIFHIFLCVDIILIVVLFLISNESLYFDMGLVLMGVAIITICVDACLNKRSPGSVIQRVDWSVLLMFFGMFVWLYGLNKTNAPRYIWDQLNVGAIMEEQSITSYFVFYAFILICSNIFSNVPLTIIVLELLTPCTDQLELVLYLGWVATIAGNLSLFGSVANLIVAQKALSTIRYRLGFFEYLRYGFVTTIILSCCGMWLIYGLLKLW